MRLSPSKDLALRRAEGRVPIKFASELAELQLQNGRHFLIKIHGQLSHGACQS